MVVLLVSKESRQPRDKINVGLHWCSVSSWLFRESRCVYRCIDGMAAEADIWMCEDLVTTGR